MKPKTYFFVAIIVILMAITLSPVVYRETPFDEVRSFLTELGSEPIKSIIFWSNGKEYYLDDEVAAGELTKSLANLEISYTADIDAPGAQALRICFDYENGTSSELTLPCFYAETRFGKQAFEATNIEQLGFIYDILRDFKDAN